MRDETNDHPDKAVMDKEYRDCCKAKGEEPSDEPYVPESTKDSTTDPPDNSGSSSS